MMKKKNIGESIVSIMASIDVNPKGGSAGKGKGFKERIIHRREFSTQETDDTKYKGEYSYGV